MAISPCNTLNVKTLRFSQLASANLPLSASSLINISEYDGKSYFSKKTTLSDLKDFISLSSVNYSKTASYLLKNSSYLTNYLTYYESDTLKPSFDLKLYYQNASFRILNFSSSIPRNSFFISAKDDVSFDFFNLRRTGKNTYPNVDAITYSVINSGSIGIIMPSGSFQIHNSGIRAGSAVNEVYVYQQKRNCLFFWPYMASNAAARDAGIGIGVQPPVQPTGSANQYLQAKLQINMFSGSNEGNFPGGCAGITNRQTAILVNYGSGSATTGFTPTFFVSSSGNTYVGGTMYVNKNLTTTGGITGSVKLASTTGGASTLYLPIKINGVTYKILLYNS